MFVDLDDYNRVKLDMVDMPEYTDYVNASYIHVTSDILVFLFLILVNRCITSAINLILNINVCWNKWRNVLNLNKYSRHF